MSSFNFGVWDTMEVNGKNGLNEEELPGYNREQIMQMLRMLQRLIVKGGSDSNPALLVIKFQIQLIVWSLATGIDTLGAVQGALQCALDRLHKMQVFDDIRQEDGSPDDWG